ncbi:MULTISPECIES: hypothetical protein [unclassified Pseudonocardia]|uniref:hypothetical protein n=1 Tax=unclassified Pseudonocardia TaxID=2619320 RepID=UPI000761BE94|nr:MULTISPECIES: hypothetical protein [unclassified Pseudonocardia]
MGPVAVALGIVLGISGAGAGGVTAAHAAPDEVPGAPPRTGAAPGPAAPRPVCTAEDPRAAELSGLVAEGPPGAGPVRYRAIVDGGGTGEVLTLDPVTCAVTEIRDTGVRVTDVEDLGATPDGTLWLADIGDNRGDRGTVRLVELPVSGPARAHDLVYPDGPRDAEAILLADDGTPLIVAKTTGAAGVYRPAGPLDGGATPVTLDRVGEVVLPYSATSGGPLGATGTRTVTGGAVGPPGADGGRVAALRTYTDAWVFPLRPPPDGRVSADALVEALRAAPLPVPLPDEAQGEAVALDGRGTLHSGSEARGLSPAGVRAVPGVATAATAAAAPVVAQPAEVPRTGSFPPWLPAVAGAGVLGVLLLAGIGAMVLHGRRRS